MTLSASLTNDSFARTKNCRSPTYHSRTYHSRTKESIFLHISGRKFLLSSSVCYRFSRVGRFYFDGHIIQFFMKHFFVISILTHFVPCDMSEMRLFIKSTILPLWKYQKCDFSLKIAHHQVRIWKLPLTTVNARIVLNHLLVFFSKVPWCCGKWIFEAPQRL